MAIELLTIQTVYAVRVLRWRPPALADLQFTSGTIEDTERVCHSVGHPARSSVCHHEVVLADGAGSFLFPDHAVDSVDRLLNANEDRLAAGEHVDLWHQPGKPERAGGSLGAIWQLRGDGWVIPYGTATAMNTSPELEGLGCAVLFSVVAGAACVQEAGRRRRGRGVRDRAGRELALIAVLTVATCAAVAMEQPSLVWPAFSALAFVVVLALYAERG